MERRHSIAAGPATAAAAGKREGAARRDSVAVGLMLQKKAEPPGPIGQFGTVLTNLSYVRCLTVSAFKLNY